VRALAWGGLAGPLAGCGGGVPLLHPAATLPRGEVRAAGGVTANVALGAAASAYSAAQQEAQAATTTPTDATYARGALVAAALAPGLAPYVAARVGLGHDFEAGLAYTGRGGRVDVRHAFGLGGATALSVGLGATAALYGTDSGAALPGVDLAEVRAFGADLPVLVGWHSTGGLYMIWGGLRAGYDRTRIAPVSSETAAAPDVRALTADRWYGAAVVGAAAGLGHVHVALELDAAYQTVSGTFGDTPASVSGVTLAPAGALWWDF
jgi:hypothetical protein